MEHIYHHTSHLLKQVVDNKVFFLLSKCTIEKISIFLKSLSQMTIQSKYDIMQKK